MTAALTAAATLSVGCFVHECSVVGVVLFLWLLVCTGLPISFVHLVLCRVFGCTRVLLYVRLRDALEEPSDFGGGGVCHGCGQVCRSS